MKQHALTQGSPAWLAYRAEHFNASDAPAMMGCSKYKTRSQLLHEMHTGISPEVDAGTQRRFDDGHRTEALARPLGEEFIGQDLYPVVGSEGRLSASFDGLTMDESIGYEHKTLNDELRTAMFDGCTGADLPPMYRVQLEHQWMVGKCDRILFMASKWQGEELIEERHCWYEHDADLSDAVMHGWAQFAIDLAAYVPPVIAAVAVAAPVDSLPAVMVRMGGDLIITSNLPEFGTALRTFIERIPAKASTDQEFADTESACKALKKAEDALDAADASSLAELGGVEEVRRLIADLRNLARTTRLAKEKDVTARKDQIRVELVMGGRDALAAHVESLNTRLGKPYMPATAADFAGAIKGKRTIDSLRDAVNTTLANAKIEANATADKIQINLGTLRDLAGAHVFLFPDTAQIVLKAGDDLTTLVRSRIAEHDAKEAARIEAERVRIRIEEQAKAEKLARDNLAAEVEAARIVKEREDKITADAAAAAVVDAAVVEPAPAPAAARRFAGPAMVTADNTPPTLRLGQIGERLGFGLTAEFLRTLGFEPAGRERAAVLYHEVDFSRICAALISHISEVLEPQAA